MKKVLVFGVFDRLHPGHIHFLNHAASHGDELVVAVARDSVVKLLKNKIPHDTEDRRCEALRCVSGVSRVKLGDEIMGTYVVLHEEKPDVVCLGYDQKGLLADLQKKIAEGIVPAIDLITLDAHEPHLHKTSLLAKA